MSCSFTSYAQSCVCYQNHFLNDYKEADFVAQVVVTDVSLNHNTLNEDLVLFTTTKHYKGQGFSPLFIQQAIGNSHDNSKCRLYVQPGDELIIFANHVNDRLVTTSCKRNSFVFNNDQKFLVENQVLLGTLDQLSTYNEAIEESTTNCSTLADGGNVLVETDKLDLSADPSFIGLYNVKFTEDHKVEYIGVLSAFNKEIDKKIRIMLIKKEWEPCELNENRELIVGYFYHPATDYRKSFLSTF